MNVRFFGGRKEEYVSIPKHNPIGLYFCADTRELFLGDRLLSDGLRVVSTFADLPSISEHKAAEGIIYFVEETKNGYVLPRGCSEWLQVIYAPTTDDGTEVDLSNYYTRAEVDEAILEAIANIKIEVDLTDYATKEEVTAVEAKIPSLEGYVKAEDVTAEIKAAINEIEIPEVPTKVSELVNDKGYITLNEVPKVELGEYAKKEDLAKFITEVPAEYITESELEAKGYLTEHQSLEGYAKLADLPSVDGLASESYVDAKVAAIKIPEVPTKVSELENDAGYITAKDIPETDLSNYYDKTETENLIAEAVESIEHPTVDLSDYTTKDYVVATTHQNKYEVLPIEGMFVQYRDGEIRLNTQRVTPVHQNVGTTGNPNMYYATFRAFAPEGATQCREGLNGNIDTEYSVLATDKYGRKYTTIWAAIASYNGTSWSLFGANSNLDKYLGFYYHFEWYNEDTLIGTDKVRVILTNDTCHDDLVPDAVARRIDDKIKAIDIPKTDLTGYATEEFVADEIAKINIPEVSDFITMSDVEAKNYLTEHQDISHLAEKDHVHTEYATKVHEHEQYLTEHQDLSEYAKKSDIPTDYLKEIPSEYITETELNEAIAGIEQSTIDLSEYAKKSEIPSLDGLATEKYVNTAIGGIEIPEAEIYKVDFNAPDYAKAVEAYNNGKVLVLTNAAPDVNSYAIMNYVSEKYITFTKFLTSRSEAYGSFNTYYLSPANIWETSKEVKLNKVEANAEGEVNSELINIRIGKEIYSLPSTNGLASTEYVDKAIGALEIPEVPTNVSEFTNDAGYLTQHQDISHLATKEEIPDVSGFITEIPEDYVTEAELTAKGYLTEHQDLSDYALKTDIPTDYLKAIPAEYITETELAEELAKIEHPSVDLTGYATEQFVSEAIAEIKIPDVSDFVTMSDVEAKGYITEIPTKYITESELAAKGFITDISGKADAEHKHTLSDIEDYSAPDLSDYAKKTDIPDVSDFIKEVPAEYITEAELAARGYISDISGKADINHDHNDLYDAKGAAQAVRDELLNGAGEAYDTLKELGSLIDDNKEALDALETIATGKADKEHIHSEYLTKQALDDYAKKTEIPDVTGFIKEIPAEYITETELEAKGFITEHQDLSDYAKLTDIPTDYLKEVPSEYVTEAELADKGYLTEHQSLEAYAKKDELFSKSYHDLTDKPEIPNIEGLATEEFVRTEIAQIDIPTVDTANLVTTETLANALVVKANEVPFTSAKFITKPFGNFEYGENIKDLSVAEIFAKLLGLEDTDPNAQGLVATIIHNQTPMYQITDNDEMVEIPWTGVIQYSSAEAATIKDGQTGFYKVVNESGEIIEAGYQHYSTAKDPWYIVALPEVLAVAENGNVLLQTWNPAENKWDKAVYVLTADYEEIVSAYDEAGIKPPVAPEGYRLWADLSESDPGTLYRFIIKE